VLYLIHFLLCGIQDGFFVSTRGKSDLIAIASQIR
jgi:hypothetical protein